MRAAVRADPKFCEITGQAVRVRCGITISALLAVLMAGCQSFSPIHEFLDLSNHTDRLIEAPHTGPMVRPQGPVSLTSLSAPLPVLTVETEQIGPHETVTLKDVEQLASKHNPALAIAAARIEIAQGHRAQAGLYPNPMVGYHGTQIGLADTVGAQGGFISQQIITGGKLDLDRRISGKTLSEAELILNSEESRVLTDVRVRFYHTLVAQRRRALTKELAQISDDLVTATKKLFQARQGTANAILQAQIKADQAHILSDNAENHVQETRRRLAAVVGVTINAIGALKGDLETKIPDLSWEASCTAVLSGNPELLAAQLRLERATLAIERAEKEPLPNLDVSFSMRHQNISSEEVANVQVGFPLPIFNKNEGNIRAARAELAAAAKEIERIQFELKDQLAGAYRKYIDAQQETKRYRTRMIPQAKESLGLVTKGYEMGQIDYPTLLIAHKTHIEVNLAYNDALRQLHEALAMIKGQLLTGSLKSRK